MGDHATFQGNDPAAHAPEAAAYDKGKGKAIDDPMDVSMDEDEESEESDAEEPMAEDDDDEGDNLEPISADNIITGGRTRGKNIDFQEAAERIKEDEMEDDEDDDDEDFEPIEDNKQH
ncbi:histone chaperone domain CHZ-domain-containing protein [Aspergillus spectabilis]